MAYVAARTCSHVNGVSRLHAEVSRHLFQDLYPRWPGDQVPVTHVTNGVHVPSWDSAAADDLWTRACGKNRWQGGFETLQRGIEALGDDELWTFRSQQRTNLVRRVRARLSSQLRGRGLDPEQLAQAENVLDPNALTLGFARRFTEYKRPNLLLQDAGRFSRLLQDPRHPAQIIVAGKAHPEDDHGKQMLQQWVQFAEAPWHRSRVVVLEDYDIALAQELVQGVDVWVNTPRRPWEASGTSGMKVLVNGGINLSELDGWWAEAYTPEAGWGLGGDSGLPAAEQDRIEGEKLYRLLEEEVIPTFYGRDESGIPRGWVARMRASMAGLTGQFSTNRMLQEYAERMYIPAAQLLHQRTADGGKEARELRQWELELTQHWSEIHFGDRTVTDGDGTWVFDVAVYLGEIRPDAVEVQLYAEPVDGNRAYCEPMSRTDTIPGAINGYRYRAEVPRGRPAEHFTPRVVPHHANVTVPSELDLIRWPN
jgi:starch phosphorylase